MDTATIVVLAILGSSGFWGAVLYILNRKKTQADVLFVTAQTEETAVSTRKSETAYYQDLVDKLVPKLEALEKAQEANRLERDSDRKESVMREASLHEKIDRLTTDLKRANGLLDTANETIGSLRDKVDGLQDKVTELQEKITGLLVDRAEKKK